ERACTGLPAVENRARRRRVSRGDARRAILGPYESRLSRREVDRGARRRIDCAAFGSVCGTGPFRLRLQHDCDQSCLWPGGAYITGVPQSRTERRLPPGTWRTHALSWHVWSGGIVSAMEISIVVPTYNQAHLLS